MAKKADGKDPLQRAEGKLARAQIRFDAAQDDYVQARMRGKQEIDRARLRAEELMTRASERLQKRAAKLARLESSVRELRGDPTPEEAANLLERQNGDTADPTMQSEDQARQR